MLKTLAPQKAVAPVHPPPSHPLSDPPPPRPAPLHSSLGLAACAEGGSRRCFMDFNADGAIALH